MRSGECEEPVGGSLLPVHLISPTSFSMAFVSSFTTSAGPCFYFYSEFAFTPHPTEFIYWLPPPQSLWCAALALVRCSYASVYLCRGLSGGGGGGGGDSCGSFAFPFDLGNKEFILDFVVVDVLLLVSPFGFVSLIIFNGREFVGPVRSIVHVYWLCWLSSWKLKKKLWYLPKN